MINRKIKVKGSKVLVMGFAFKENCTDIRNTKVAEIVHELKDFNCITDVYDPWVKCDEAKKEYNICLIKEPRENCYDAIILAVAHKQFRNFDEKKIRSFGKKSHVLYDLKYLLNFNQSDLRL